MFFEDELKINRLSYNEIISEIFRRNVGPMQNL